jgi:hypothetical protein
VKVRWGLCNAVFRGLESEGTTSFHKVDLPSGRSSRHNEFGNYLYVDSRWMSLELHSIENILLQHVPVRYIIFSAFHYMKICSSEVSRLSIRSFLAWKVYINQL